jgi:hypothetical protein
LLKPILARIEQEHLPCYLSTQREENIRIYQRYGFEVVEDIEIPGTDMRTWGMLRGNPSPDLPSEKESR